MLTVLFFMALAVALLLPDTLVGKVLRDLLIDLPARQLAKLTPARILFGVIVISAIAGFIAFGKGDGLMLVARSLPEAMGWFGALDVATYVDFIGLIVMTAAAVRVREAFGASCAAAARVWRWSMQRAKRLNFIGHRATARRRRPRKTTRPPSDGDDRGWCAPAYAWA